MTSISEDLRLTNTATVDEAKDQKHGHYDGTGLKGTPDCSQHAADKYSLFPAKSVG